MEKKTDREFSEQYAKLLQKQFLHDDNYIKIADCVITALSFVALFSVAITMPNTLRLLKPILKKKNFSDRQIRSSIDGLRRTGHITFRKNSNIKITPKGYKKVKKYSIESIKVAAPKYWNGRWQVVIFDVPVRFTRARNAFRFKLRQIGFMQLQKSVWIYPYECEEQIVFIADFFEVKKYIESMVAYKILNEEKLLNFFDLSRT